VSHNFVCVDIGAHGWRVGLVDLALFVVDLACAGLVPASSECQVSFSIRITQPLIADVALVAGICDYAELSLFLPLLSCSNRSCSMMVLICEECLLLSSSFSPDFSAELTRHYRVRCGCSSPDYSGIFSGWTLTILVRCLHDCAWSVSCHLWRASSVVARILCQEFSKGFSLVQLSSHWAASISLISSDAGLD